MSYNKPIVYVIPDPKGLDLALFNIQEKLAELTWLEKVFGRAWTMLDYQGEGKRLVTTSQGIKPKLYTGPTSTNKDGNYTDALPNDYLQSYSFFVVEGPEIPVDFSSTATNIVNRQVSLVVWTRLNKIDPTKQYVFTENLKEDVYSKLKSISKITISRYEDETQEVWSGFDWSANENKNLRYPNVGFRIYFDLTYYDITC